MAWIGFVRNVSDPAQALGGTPFDHAILEGPASTELIRYGIAPIRWEDFDRGVLFGMGAEARVRRRRDGCFHLVMIADVKPAGAMGWTWKELAAGQQADSSVFLWGEPDRDAGGWFEGRIPNRLPYEFPPGAAGSRVATVTKQYWLKDERREVWRYVRMEVRKP